ncbi:uncharacterized protein A4U43_C03F22900 [Asparagus officinalis]|uniref:DEK-C domain-containing protein n=1 Tax=Asparagus officinalis TaxID=4686 RepID=A0A5P1FH88_ASPOF|nr:uncharacterized protein A4U43_C03F22900 [Asparagus officinalis]
MVTDGELVERLRTTASVRRQLEADLDLDLSDKKPFIREQVDLFLRELENENKEEQGEEEEEEENAAKEEEEEEEEEGSEEKEDEAEEEKSNAGSSSKLGMCTVVFSVSFVFFAFVFIDILLHALLHPPPPAIPPLLYLQPCNNYFCEVKEGQMPVMDVVQGYGLSKFFATMKILLLDRVEDKIKERGGRRARAKDKSNSSSKRLRVHHHDNSY